MVRVRQEFDSRQYDPHQDMESESCRFRIETYVVLDKGESTIEIDTYEHHQPPSSETQSFGTKVVLSDWSSLQKLKTQIERHLRKQDGRTRSVTLQTDSGQDYASRIGQMNEDVKEVTFTLDDRGLHTSTQGASRGRLPYYQRSVKGELQDHANLLEFYDMLEEVLDDTTPKSILKLENPELLTEAEPEYQNGHYQSAVRTAFRVLEEQIREKGNFDVETTGSSLAQEAFKEGGELEIGEVSAEVRGWMFLYTGGFLALRNPLSHRNIPEIDQDRARRILSFVDLLLQTLEEEYS